MTNYKFQQFSQYILRTPSFPLSYYTNLLNEYTLHKAIASLEDSFFKESMLLASPELLGLLEKLKENPQNFAAEKKEALTHTLLKYRARISSRATPFGLFAGCTVGHFAEETNIQLQPHTKFERFTQFDMQFWIGFLKTIETQDNIRSVLRYYPNNSMYAFGDFYRFIEYKYDNKKREHSISALRKTDLLTQLLEHCKTGATIASMVAILADDASEQEEATQFVTALIDYQFLVSELEPSVSGNNEWERVLQHIQKSSASNNIKTLVTEFQHIFKRIDSALINNDENYKKIATIIEKMGFEYDQKYLFQTDLNVKTVSNTLNSSVATKVRNTLLFLNGIQERKKNKNQERFKKAFLERYETREMPLATILDTEIGIGYLQHNKKNDSHNLLDNFSFSSSSKSNHKEEVWKDIDFILEKKIQECAQNNAFSFQLAEIDFPNFNPDIKNTPATFSALVEVTHLDEKETIIMCSSGDTSASKLLGRFCSGNQEIHRFVNEIILKEKDYHANKITAEIVHIPESRTGNILRRPVLREYEIPYLSSSAVESEFQIPMEDLTLSIVKDRIVLKSKKLGKEIVPFLSNAHNYSFNSLPLYHFLCELQDQDIKPIYNFSWGALESHYNFFPRVYYKDVIIAKAKWNVSKEEIQKIAAATKNRFETFTTWRKSRSLSKYVNWVQYDNTLLLDLDKAICVELLLNSISKIDTITLEEFLFTEKSVVQNQNEEDYANQFIVSFYKEAL